jgi:activator of HSP90 ATPase
MSTTIHHEVLFNTSPERIYELLLETEQFSKMSGGAPTVISREEGGAFTVFGGKIVGRNIELVPNQRIVQAWRSAAWEAGVYSVIKYELKQQGSETLLVFEHTGFPDSMREQIDNGWTSFYWEPMKKFFA